MPSPPGKARRRAHGNQHKGAPAAQGKSHKSALAVLPPQALWEPLQAIRRDYDPQYARWMPHINLLYPFRPREAWAAVIPALARALTQVPAFELRLDEPRMFRPGPSNFTLWLAPEPAAALDRLHEALWQVVPECDDVRRHTGGFTPHLTLAQLNRRQSAEALLARLQSEWRGLSFRVEEVSLLWRDDPPDDRFRVGERLALGTAATPS